MDGAFILAHVPDYLSGAWVTLRFGLYGVACSLALGLLCCLLRYFRVPVLRQIAGGYIELARACIGLTRGQNIRYVVFPQALATAVPALFANVIFLIKETSVFSVLAMMDLMNVADTLRTSGGRTVEVLFMLMVAYLLILLPVSILATLVERRLRYAGFGDQRSV